MSEGQLAKKKSAESYDVLGWFLYNIQQKHAFTLTLKVRVVTF